jgi:cold shock CspA family protein
LSIVAVVRLGVVSEYDAERGLGVVREDGDGAEHGFHCTAIADGTRQVEVGAEVAYVVERAHGGRYEAASLVKLNVRHV